MLQTLSTKTKKDIIIYNGPGTSIDSVEHTLITFRQYCRDECKVKTINLEEFKNSNWEQTTYIFIMPGGADRPYQSNLSGSLNLRIKKFVSEGGNYIGICAGAYYGSSSIVFSPNTGLEIIEERELKFFPGTAYGPALAAYDYKSSVGARSASILTNFEKLQSINLFFNGGCYFDIEEVNNHNCAVLGKYANLPDNPAAIILCNVDKGHALLSGVHFEYNPNFLHIPDQHLKSVSEDLKKHEVNRLNLVDKLLSTLTNLDKNDLFTQSSISVTYDVGITEIPTNHHTRDDKEISGQCASSEF